MELSKWAVKVSMHALIKMSYESEHVHIDKKYLFKWPHTHWSIELVKVGIHAMIKKSYWSEYTCSNQEDLS